MHLIPDRIFKRALEKIYVYTARLETALQQIETAQSCVIQLSLTTLFRIFPSIGKICFSVFSLKYEVEVIVFYFQTICIGDLTNF